MRKAMLENAADESAVEAGRRPPRPDMGLGPTISAAVDDYKRRARAGKREATANNVAAHLDPWQRRMAGRGYERTGELTTKAVLDDLIWYRKTPSERTGELRLPLSVSSHATHVKSFLSDCYDRGYIAKRILDDYDVPRGARGETCFPSSSHLNAFLGVVDDMWDPDLRPEISDWSPSILRWFPLRFKAILLVQMTTALRIGETCHLETTSWDKERMVIRAVITKSGKPLDVPVVPVVGEIIEEWLKVRPKSSPTNYLFTTEIGTKIDPRTISQTLRRYLGWARGRGVELPRITLHSLRRYALSAVAGVSLDRAQELAGHADPKTTKLYVKTTTEAVREAVQQANLLDGIVINKRAKKRGGTPRGKRLIGK